MRPAYVCVCVECMGTYPHIYNYRVCISAHCLRNSVFQLTGIMDTEPSISSVSQQHLSWAFSNCKPFDVRIVQFKKGEKVP